MNRLPLSDLCPLDDLRMPITKKMVLHLSNNENHRKELISQIIMCYPDDYPLCVVEPCREYIGYDDYDRLIHLEGHGRGLVSAWLEAVTCKNFKLRNPNDIKKSSLKRVSKTSLDEFFWR